MIVIYGPAGAGKSTQGELLAKKLGRKALSVGQICREYFAEYTKTGAMVEYDELTKAIMEEIEAAGDCVLDGQPWDAEGAKILERAGFWRWCEAVVVLDVPREESLRRLAQRGRDDDNEMVWNKKLKMFEQKSSSFLTPVRELGVPVVKVDGMGSVQEVAERLYKAVQPYLAQD